MSQGQPILITVPDDQINTFNELQRKIQTTSKAFQAAQSNLQVLRQERRIQNLTLDELKKLPNATRCYQGVGKSFVLTDKPVLERKLKSNDDQAQVQEKSLQTQLEMLEKKRNEFNGSMNDLIKSLREAQD